MYTDCAALPWLFGIDDPSERLIRWRLRLSQFNFEVEYNKVSFNAQEAALPRLHTSMDSTPHKNSDDITVYFPNLVNVDLKFYGCSEEQNFIDVQYRRVDELLASKKEVAPPSTHFRASKY